MLHRLLSDARYRLRALFRRDAVERELDDELRFHLEREAEKLVKAGVQADEAMRRARLAFGGVDRFKEGSRDGRGISWLETLGRDLRFAARRLRAAPGFTAVTVTTLALGIGATTAIFSAVNPILFEPLPYPDGRRIAVIIETGQDGSRNDGSFGMYRGLAEKARAFEALAVLKPWAPSITGVDRPERFEGQRVSAAYFTVLGVAPAIGRDFQAADDVAGGPNVTIISHGLWQRRFNGDSAILGRQVTLGDNSFAVIGVMPAGFENVLGPAAELWAPLQYAMSEGRAWGHHLQTVGRMRPGVTTVQATADVERAGHEVLAEQRPPTYGDTVSFVAAALHDEVTRAVKPALLAILGAVMLVLVIACVNVTNLLLARGVQRRGEFALRAALGAGRGRLIRQLLTESLLLALMGGAAGVVVAVLGVRALVALSPPGLPRVDAIAVDGAVLAFALLVTTIIGLVFGIVPALQAARADMHESIQQGSRRSAGAHRRTRGALVIAEVALALVLLVSSGLLLRSLNRLFAVESGFDGAGVLTMQVQTTGRRFANDSAFANRTLVDMLDAVKRVPGVTAAALTSQLPLSGDRDEYGVQFDGLEGGFSSFRYGVSPGYLETMRIPLVRGRAILEGDAAGAPLVVLLNESFAKRMYPNADPIGKQVRIGPAGPYTVVGLVGDVRQLSLAGGTGDAAYVSLTQWPFPDNAYSLAVRGQGDVSTLVPAVREAVWSVDKERPITRVAMMEELLLATASERRFALVLFEAFGLAALLLAGAGIYGVLAGSVAERTREIGVRAALGASRGMIVGLIVRQGLSLTGLGMLIGLAGAVLATQALAGLLFGISRLDAVTYVGVVALLGVVSLLACGVPAWRAARVDPARTLRSE